jgi:hypothetical protein
VDQKKQKKKDKNREKRKTDIHLKGDSKQIDEHIDSQTQKERA